MKKIAFLSALLIIPVVAVAATAKKQSAIQNGTNVRARVAAKGIYSQECYDEYYGCMDQFCMSENINGGSCLCSNSNTKYEAELEEINEMLAEADRVKTVEVEKIKLGANADIVFTGERKYDEKGNVIKVGEMTAADKRKSKRESLMKMFETNLSEEDDEEDDDDIMHKTGAELFKVADDTCRDQLGSSCVKDIKLLKQIYQRQIESDCRGFANSIAEQRAAAKSAMNSAESDVRTALKESFDSSNKFNQGECMVELKNCMLGADACGDDWVNCVSIIANENMQNKTATSTAGTKVSTTVAYDITPSVLERLESKRTICERVLDQCMAVRNNVWTAFLREVAPSLKLAELRAESNVRQSCLTDITKCIQTACKDDIVGKGKATMDSCLSRPDMARSFCKVQLDPCERMEPLIWGYVKDKLAAMRVDACTQEVKDCIYSEDRCGPDFMNCIGMDWEFVHNLCPLDKLVVCKANNKNFKMEDIDSMIMGLYLNMDNKALENCQKVVEDKMMEICGSTTDCNRWASDETIGTGSLRSVKDGNVYRITGMISFDMLNVGDGSTKKDGGKKLGLGKVGVKDYMARAREVNDGVKDSEGILASIEMELNSVAEKINRVIDMIELDPKIQFCVTGRSLDQITGDTGTSTVARFPNLLNQYLGKITSAALNKASENQRAKFDEYVAKASRDAEVDIAQYNCQMLPFSRGIFGGKAVQEQQVNLAPPYAISYEVGVGLDNRLLAQGGHGTSATSGMGSVSNERAGYGKGVGDKVMRGLSAAVSLGASEGVYALSGAGNKSAYNIPGGTRQMWSTFNRETRICRLCSSTVTKSCNTVHKNGFLGIGQKDEVNCTESDPVEKCEDMQM
ncbi:MAG: hypothetical protein J6Y07_03700 [Alphaproteobacteria bacterium]|nr:hypothetical protein [Alphaproteobacteria bacterium]